MSQRQTEDWTDDAEGAFGENGRVGDAGELVGLRILKVIFGNEVQHHPSDIEKQKAGHDYTVFGKFGIDLKTNWHGKHIIVDFNYIWKTRATFWMHLNLKTEEFVIYKVSDMHEHLRNLKPSYTRKGPLYFLANDLEFYTT